MTFKSWKNMNMPPVENDEPEMDPYGDPNKKKEDHPR